MKLEQSAGHRQRRSLSFGHAEHWMKGMVAARRLYPSVGCLQRGAQMRKLCVPAGVSVCSNGYLLV